MMRKMFSKTSMVNKRECINMWQGNRRLIEPVDDWTGVDFDDNILDEVLKPYVRVRREYLPNQELYASSAHACGIEIKKW